MLPLLAMLLFAQTANAWAGTWKWGEYAERIAWGEQFIAQSARGAVAASVAGPRVA